MIRKFTPEEMLEFLTETLIRHHRNGTLTDAKKEFLLEEMDYFAMKIVK
jgi:uncharacterized protein (DUF2164 family)